MSEWFPFCPRPPQWRVDWEAVERRFAWAADLAACPQDPSHHAEGDVWTHTRMACEALATLPAFRALPADERLVLFVATLLHDIGKPDTTRRDLDGRLTTRGHSRRGSILSRRMLWRMAAPFAEREQVAALIRHHQVPFNLFDRPDTQRTVIEVSQTVRCDLLALLAEADGRGRICADQPRILENVALFVEACREEGCLHEPYPFASDHTRFWYFRTEGREPAYAAFDDTRCEVTVLSGLPGAGKDHWIRAHAPEQPVISLDALRAELGVTPTEPHGPVIERARARARAHLRRGEGFVWNATNLSRDLRERCIGLCADYRARVRIVYVEAPEEQLLRQNRDRAQVVPEHVIARLLDRWETPDRTEAHRVDWVVSR